MLDVKEWGQKKKTTGQTKASISLTKTAVSVFESVISDYLSGFFDSQTNAEPKKEPGKLLVIIAPT